MSDVVELSELLPIKINGDVRIKTSNGHATNVNRQSYKLNHKSSKLSGQFKLKEFRAKTDYTEISGVQLRSYNKWSPSEQGVVLAWKDVSVYAEKTKSQPKLKRIINNASGAIASGSLVALMGSSGAGKSTLMSSLAFRNPSGTIVNGDIFVNGHPIGPFMYRLSGFVHQDDLFFGSLTVMEHLSIMAHLKLDRRTKKSEAKWIIKDILERTGLTKCANTMIGDDGQGKMLSGGEKKRLAFATELLTKPGLLFCDEPTTGLDSFSAQNLVRTLQDLARVHNTAIMCTIHQPSSQLIAMFDQVLLLAEGRVAFFGQPKEALKFFNGQGYTCPKNYNPADFLIGVLATEVGHERSSQRATQRICDQFAVSDVSIKRELLVNLEMHMHESGNYKVSDEQTDFRHPRWFSTVYWLIHRFLISAYRDPTIQYLRLLQKILIALMAGLCFTGSIDMTQTGIQATQGILFIFVSENTFTPMYSVLSIFPQTFPLFLRETKSGLYSTDQYYIANIIAMLPGLILEPLVFVLIAYFLAQLRPTFYAFFITALASTLVMNVSTSCGCFFSAAFNSVPMGMAYLVPFDYILMITSGVFMKLGSLPEYLSWMPFMSWLMYGNEAMSIAQWQDIHNITCQTVEPGVPCYANGEEFLARFTFDSNNLSRDLLAMVVLYCIFHFLGYIFLWRRTRNS